MSDQDSTSDAAGTAQDDDSTTDSQDTSQDTTDADGGDDRGRAGGDKALKADLARERRQRKELEKRLGELETRDLSELQKAQRVADEASKRAEAAESSAMRLRVGLANGIPSEHLHRLQGSTEDELAEDAKALAKLLKPVGPRPDPSQGSRADSQRPHDMNSLIRAAAGR